MIRTIVLVHVHPSLAISLTGNVEATHGRNYVHIRVLGEDALGKRLIPVAAVRRGPVVKVIFVTDFDVLDLIGLSPPRAILRAP